MYHAAQKIFNFHFFADFLIISHVKFCLKKSYFGGMVKIPLSTFILSLFTFYDETGKFFLAIVFKYV